MFPLPRAKNRQLCEVAGPICDTAIGKKMSRIGLAAQREFCDFAREAAATVIAARQFEARMNQQISGIARKRLKDAAKPISLATGLPNALYASAQGLEAEKLALFAPGWAGIGFAKDVPNPGDARPVWFLGEPLLIVRNRDGAIRVFQNTCRHRGVVLVEEPKTTTGLIRCPYHAWCYDLNGQLRQTPHVGGPGIHEHPDIRKAELGLVEIRSHVWLDVVFVNLSGDAEPFERHHRALIKRWRDFARPIHFAGPESSFQLDVRTNWKLAVENYCESYHLPFIHPGLNSYSRLEDHENILGDGPWSGQLTRVYNPSLSQDGTRFPDFADLPSRWDSNAEYLSVYPNVLLGVHRDHIFAMVLEPVAHDRTIEHVAIYYASAESGDARWAELRSRNAAQWKQVFMPRTSASWRACSAAAMRRNSTAAIFRQ